MRVVSAISLALVVAAILWTLGDDDFLPSQDDNQTTVIAPDEPDIYGKDIRFNQLNPDGTLHYRLFAEAIRQYEKKQLTHMDVPHLHLRSVDQPPWDVHSITGFIRRRESENGLPEEVVFLEEDVRMVQEHPQNGMITLRSDSFYLYPDRQYAETDQDVIIDTQVGRTVAAGMMTNLDSGVITLSSSATQRVHTIVLPEQFKKS